MCPFLNAVRILILWFIIMALFVKKNQGKRMAELTWTCLDKFGTILYNFHQRCII
ncbi:unnamed protein product (macronuclear) [Paramecium tetraurelia]|uniref:Uncharacterized protein n=1 Tax=Paramecium tetraurelia TaxID=5888 RepID=A0DT82_PARTE|nr:uncharacterized protein GSPATT00019942001 [Paramecium tetraurelia]CAK86249.1 unnamed protein product [Paramecium tetraurelia]|eukprot:XP_001453646.1 hypothetical protein (macronuclear) [Paramecium tetraurelia strain d4-2]